MVFGVKSAAAVGLKTQLLTFVHMTWLDSDGKYHILCCYKYHIYMYVSILEIITMFRMKPSYLKTWY